MDWMVTERAEDLKTLMHDNATFIQFPPIGSSTSLITVIGDNRVNVQRTIRSIMQLVRVRIRVAAHLLTLALGLPILCCVVVAAAGPVQCPHAFYELESYPGFRDPEAGILRLWCRGCLQGHVL